MLPLVLCSVLPFVSCSCAFLVSLLRPGGAQTPYKRGGRGHRRRRAFARARSDARCVVDTSRCSEDILHIFSETSPAGPPAPARGEAAEKHWNSSRHTLVDPASACPWPIKSLPRGTINCRLLAAARSEKLALTRQLRQSFKRMDWSGASKRLESGWGSQPATEQVQLVQKGRDSSTDHTRGGIWTRCVHSAREIALFSSSATVYFERYYVTVLFW